MGNVNDQNTCLKATRGELLCLRNIDKEKREVPVSEAPTDPSHSPLAALLESTDFPDFGFALQLIKVTPGSELGAMDRLRAEADVIAVSLNYIGESAGLLRFRKPEPRRNEWRMLSDDPAFPGEPVIADDDRSHIAAALWVEKMHQHRVTLLRGVLEAARATFCLATGPEKAEALKRVLRGPFNPLETPAQIRSNGTVWFVDRPAAAGL